MTGRGSTGGYPWNVSSGGSGGGVWASAATTIAHSTIVQNRTGAGESQGAAGTFAGSGGGLMTPDGTLIHSVIAANSIGADGGGENAAKGPDLTVYASVAHSLIGDNDGTDLAEAQTPDTNGNLIGSAAGNGVIDPLLGDLADNGGPTPTHALLPGSPAINAGNPESVAGIDGVPLYDQRGEPFARISGGLMDMGALEVQFADALAADFNQDGNVDGDDFLLWQAGFNLFAGNATTSDGDANGDGLVNGDDLLIWQLEYDAQPPGSGAAARPEDLADRLDRHATSRSRGQMPASQDHEEASARAAIQDVVLAELDQLRPRR